MQAAIALAGAVRSTLGPKGLDKLLVDDQGQTLVTNDGVTVLETAKVEHPVAKMIITASSTQDRVIRDGTTTTVVICAEMLRNAWQLVRQGVHPSIIARGFAEAEKFALASLGELSISASDEQIKSAVETSLAGKLDKGMEKHLSKLSLEAGHYSIRRKSRSYQSENYQTDRSEYARYISNHWFGSSEEPHTSRNEGKRWGRFNLNSRWGS